MLFEAPTPSLLFVTVPAEKSYSCIYQMNSMVVIIHYFFASGEEEKQQQLPQTAHSFI